MIDPLRETIRRLRDLHGVYERALTIAGDALVEANRGKRGAEDLSGREWFQALFRRAAHELDEAGVLLGRWSLFTDDEINDLTEAVGASGSSVVGELQAEKLARGI